MNIYPRKHLFIVAVLIVISALFFLSRSRAATTDNLSGWAWSENIGWISFNCTNEAGTCAFSNYGVNIGVDDKLSGHAWSENIGWISFIEADLAGCPTAPCVATLNRAAKRLDGWARVLKFNPSDGYSGWIHLSNTTPAYGVTESGCSFKGYAWSDDIGWISFSNKNCDADQDGKSDTGAPTGCPAPGTDIGAYGVVGSGVTACVGVEADIKAQGPGGPISDGPITVNYNDTVTFRWCGSDSHPCTNAASCSVSPDGWTGTSGSQTQAATFSPSKTYTLSCTGVETNTDNVKVNVVIPTLTASCSFAPATAKAGQTVSWTASAGGGIGAYTFSWNGAPDPNPLDGKTGATVSVTYDTLSPPIKTGTVTVTSGAQTVPATCTGPASEPGATINPGIASFTAAPLKITTGQSTTLSWSAVGFGGATPCSIDQGIGPVAASGSITRSPIINTTYTLSCVDGPNSDSKTVTVTVLKVPKFEEIAPREVVP